MSTSQFGWIFSAHLTTPVWIGLGLIASILGLLLLARRKARRPVSGTSQADMQMQYMDGTSLRQ